jgi:hypothetical protein
MRSSDGNWVALSHQRVQENDDGTITLLYLPSQLSPSRVRRDASPSSRVFYVPPAAP